jgi:O-antigen/teichoic acid export membrane protein
MIRLVSMILVGLALLIALFLLIQHWVGNSIVTLFLLLGGLVVALFEAVLFGRIPRWIDSVMKDVRNLRAQ